MSASSMQRLSAASIGSPAIARPVYVSPSPEMPSSPKTAMTEQQAPLSEPVPTPSSLGDVLTTEQSNTLRVMAACTCDVNNRVQEFAVRKVSCPAQLQELSQANSVLWEACLSAIKHVFGLDMHSMELKIEHLAPFLEEMPHLRVLDLRSNKFGPAGAALLTKPLSNMVALQKLQLGGNSVGAEGATALAESLPSLPTLKQLYLHNNEIGDTGATSLAECIGDKLPELQVLWLALNSVGPRGASVLAEELKKVTMLEKLELGDNVIGPEAATALAPAIEKMAGLQHLLLANTGIGDAGVRALAPSLKYCAEMKVLRLTGNGIGPRGAKAIGESIVGMPDLELLRLTGNSIGETGMEKLAPCMESLQSLKLLYLTGCGIDDVGAAFLGPALATLVSLEELDLSANGISDQGAEDLSPAFHTLTALEQLDLHKNPMGGAGTRSVVLGLLKTTSLEKIELDQHPKDVDFERQLPWDTVRHGWMPVLQLLQEMFLRGELDDIAPFIRPTSPSEDAKARAAARAALREQGSHVMKPRRGVSGVALMQWDGPNAAGQLSVSASSSKLLPKAASPRARCASPQLRRQSTEHIRPSVKGSDIHAKPPMRRQSTATSSEWSRSSEMRPRSPEARRRASESPDNRERSRKGSVGVASLAAGAGALMLA